MAQFGCSATFAIFNTLCTKKRQGGLSPLGRGGIAEVLQQKYMIDKVMQFCYTMQMKTTLTAKLKLNTDDEQFKALRTTQLAYRDALNFVSQYAFAHGKMSNKVGLQEGTYRET